MCNANVQNAKCIEVYSNSVFFFFCCCSMTKTGEMKGAAQGEADMQDKNDGISNMCLCQKDRTKHRLH